MIFKTTGISAFGNIITTYPHIKKKLHWLASTPQSSQNNRSLKKNRQFHILKINLIINSTNLIFTYLLLNKKTIKNIHSGQILATNFKVDKGSLVYSIYQSPNKASLK